MNQSEDITYGTNDCTWRHEVSSITCDPYAPDDEKWKLVWHRYLSLGENRLFEYGWIGLKKASSPEGLAVSDEEKLFAGSLYKTITDPIPGSLQCQLDEIHADLNSCLAFTEPAIFTSNNAIYISMLGAEGNSQNGRIILVKYPYPSGPWEYCGSFLINSIDGPALGYHGFSAPSIYKKDDKWYLVVTPQINDKYLGTLIFEITDLDTAAVKRTAGIPEIIYSLYGTAGSHNGASCYLSESSGSGILYSEAVLVLPVVFKIFISHENP